MKTVLIVDDEKLIRWSLCRGLLDEFIVHTADSAEEALNMLARIAVDAVITDLCMPGMNGVEFAQRLREIRPGLPVFAITAYSSETAIRDLRSHGVLQIIPKPFDMEKVRAMLRRHLAGGEPVARSL